MLFKSRRVNIVPLGQNCIPRTVLTRSGLKPSKWQGEPTYPFDLAVFGVYEVTKSIRTDFKEFFDNLAYHEDNGVGYWVKEPNCIKFLHMQQSKTLTTDELMELYKDRIENFRKVLNNPKPILFVQVVYQDEDLVELYGELLKIRKDKHFKIAVIDFNNVVKNVKIKDVEILKLPFPNKDYEENWWNKECYESSLGREFEKRISKFCEELICKIIKEAK